MSEETRVILWCVVGGVLGYWLAVQVYRWCTVAAFRVELASL